MSGNIPTYRGTNHLYMNISQKQAILNAIEAIQAFPFDQLIADNNPSGNIDEVRFGEDSALEFKSKYEKAFSQLKTELEKGLQLYLPNQETFNNEFGQVTLDSDIANFNQYLQNFAHKDNAAEILKRVVYYEIRQGFWNKSSVKQHNIDLEKLNEAQTALDLSQKNLDQNIAKFNLLQEDINTLIKAFQQTSANANLESTEINALLTQAQETIGKINTLNISAAEDAAAIKASSTTAKQQLDQITADIKTYVEDFKQIEADNKALALSLASSLDAASERLEKAKVANDYILGQKDTIVKLVGMAADGSLGYKFDSRKTELQNGIKYVWSWMVPVSIFGALYWVYLVFTNEHLTANLGNHWVNLIVNVIKTTPAWILVGFVFTQYGKERNLQEEYAFKSAIAMTLTAYAEMLSSDDGGESTAKSSKQEMLLKSIENIYAHPTSHQDKGDKSDLLSPKQLLESLKSISEVAKNVKN